MDREYSGNRGRADRGRRVEMPRRQSGVPTHYARAEDAKPPKSERCANVDEHGDATHRASLAKGVPRGTPLASSRTNSLMASNISTRRLPSASDLLSLGDDKLPDLAVPHTYTHAPTLPLAIHLQYSPRIARSRAFDLRANSTSITAGRRAGTIPTRSGV